MSVRIISRKIVDMGFELILYWNTSQLCFTKGGKNTDECGCECSKFVPYVEYSRLMQQSKVLVYSSSHCNRTIDGGLNLDQGSTGRTEQ